jgi:hypothetical protein
LLALLPPGLAGPAAGGLLSGRITLEMEYLGESFFSEQRLSDEDLGLPPGTNLVFSDTLRFASDTWLPGPRLELNWRSAPGYDARLTVTSRTAFNRERVLQDLFLTGVLPTDDGGRWRLGAEGSLRREEYSVFGDGDWRGRIEAQREHPLGAGATLLGLARWERSRSLSDTTTHLFDFDLLRLRAGARLGSGWLPAWEVNLEGSRKRVPHGAPGSYSEARVLGGWRPAGGERAAAEVELRHRDYDTAPGFDRDFTEAEVRWRNRLLRAGSFSIGVETEARLTDYQGADTFYYDVFDLEFTAPLRHEGLAWTLSAGPATRWLRDLDNAGRDFLQGTIRASASRLIGLGGFGEVTLEAGYRDYRAESGRVSVEDLDTVFLRSDTWLLDLLVLLNAPIGLGLSLDLLGSSSWEFHREESERIQVSIVTLGVSRRF